MKLLLDTHVLLWWLNDDPRLGTSARQAISNPTHEVMVSTASLWEIVVKVRIGKLEADIDVVEGYIERQAFRRLAITPQHLKVLTGLPTHHRDPFDHLLTAQAISEQAILLTDDRRAALYPVEWRPCANAPAWS